MDVKVVGAIEFGNHAIKVYASLDEPLFRASDIADMLDYSTGNVFRLLDLCEHDEKLKLPVVVAGQRRQVSFITETGLYNILSQSRMPLARMWRRVIHRELIELRRSRGMDIADQFEEWDHQLDSIYYDEDTGYLMESVTTANGDVEQIPVKNIG